MAKILRATSYELTLKLFSYFVLFINLFLIMSLFYLFHTLYQCNTLRVQIKKYFRSATKLFLPPYTPLFILYIKCMHITLTDPIKPLPSSLFVLV